MPQCLIAANWKLNGDWQLCQQFAALQAQLVASPAQFVLCPPAVYLQSLFALLESEPPAGECPVIALGAQNVAAQPSGAYTGEHSAAMLSEVGARYCLVGHSERRTDFAETDKDVAAKTAQLLAAGIKPIICVGEHLAQRESGRATEVIEAQLSALAEVLSAAGADNTAGIVIAYEPVWAIGTGHTATPEQAQQVHEHIRMVLGRYCDAAMVPLLYGGSVNPSNAASLLAMPDINGALVGGASLDPEQLLAIIDAAEPS